MPLSSRRDAATLVAASFVVLFQELVLIRWVGAQVRVVAYFPNVILISAFLGLGSGALMARRRSLLLAWPLLIVANVAMAFATRRISFTQEAVSEPLWLLYYDLPKTAPVVHGVRLPIVLTFILGGASFVPLGQLVGRLLDDFRVRGEALTGYCLDLFGSLTGVIAFGAFSFGGAFQWLWFVVIFVTSLVFLRRPATIGIVAVCCLVTLGVVCVADIADAYSPYYALRKIDLPEGRGFLILANGAPPQYAAPTRRGDELHSEDATILRDGFHYPYRVLGHPPARVLVLGAGSGNDTAAALDEGAGHVDAVEIDPVILKMGQDHPDRPYASPRVRTINTDARAFLNRTGGEYDLIVFGALDSMTRLSALSNIRLDNFVYTRECIAAAKRHLAADGGLVLYFAVPHGYIDEHLRQLLSAGFGHPPAVALLGRYHHLYLARDAFPQLP